MKALFTTLLIAISSFCFSQKWALPSSTWGYVYAWLSPIHYGIIRGVKDTVIAGVSCKSIGQYDPIYTYEANDTVFFLFNGKFRPTYYFNAHVGDTVSFYNAEFTCSPNDTIIKAIITAIDSIVLPNQTLKRFHPTAILDSTGLTLAAPLSAYTEKIGSNYIYPYFYFNCIFDQESYSICSYFDSTLSQYFLFPNDSCLITSITDINPINRIKVYPNPAFNSINLDTDIAVDYTLYNLIGQLIQRGSKQPNEPINISQLCSGLFFLQITEPNSKYNSTLKFIKN